VDTCDLTSDGSDYVFIVIYKMLQIIPKVNKTTASILSLIMMWIRLRGLVMWNRVIGDETEKGIISFSVS